MSEQYEQSRNDFSGVCARLTFFREASIMQEEDLSFLQFADEWWKKWQPIANGTKMRSPGGRVLSRQEFDQRVAQGRLNQPSAAEARQSVTDVIRQVATRGRTSPEASQATSTARDTLRDFVGESRLEEAKSTGKATKRAAKVAAIAAKIADRAAGQLGWIVVGPDAVLNWIHEKANARAEVQDRLGRVMRIAQRMVTPGRTNKKMTRAERIGTKALNIATLPTRAGFTMARSYYRVVTTMARYAISKGLLTGSAKGLSKFMDYFADTYKINTQKYGKWPARIMELATMGLHLAVFPTLTGAALFATGAAIAPGIAAGYTAPSKIGLQALAHIGVVGTAGKFGSWGFSGLFQSVARKITGSIGQVIFKDRNPELKAANEYKAKREQVRQKREPFQQAKATRQRITSSLFAEFADVPNAPDSTGMAVDILRQLRGASSLAGKPHHYTPTQVMGAIAWASGQLLGEDEFGNQTGGTTSEEGFEAFGYEDWKQIAGGKWQSPGGRVLSGPVYQRLSSQSKAKAKPAAQQSNRVDPEKLQVAKGVAEEAKAANAIPSRLQGVMDRHVQQMPEFSRESYGAIVRKMVNEIWAEQQLPIAQRPTLSPKKLKDLKTAMLKAKVAGTKEEAFEAAARWSAASFVFQEIEEQVRDNWRDREKEAKERRKSEEQKHRDEFFVGGLNPDIKPQSSNKQKTFPISVLRGMTRRNSKAERIDVTAAKLGWWTDLSVMVKLSEKERVEFQSSAADKFMFNRVLPVEEVAKDWNSADSKSTADPSSVVGYMTGRENGREYAIVRGNNKNNFLLTESRYLDLIRSKHPNAEWTIQQGSGSIKKAVIARVGGQLVGVALPIADEHLYPVAKIVPTLSVKPAATSQLGKSLRDHMEATIAKLNAGNPDIGKGHIEIISDIAAKHGKQGLIEAALAYEETKPSDVDRQRKSLGRLSKEQLIKRLTLGTQGRIDTIFRLAAGGEDIPLTHELKRRAATRQRPISEMTREEYATNNAAEGLGKQHPDITRQSHDIAILSDLFAKEIAEDRAARGITSTIQTIRQGINRNFGNSRKVKEPSTAKYVDNEIKNLYARAIQEGKPVPPVVLADYPELKQQPTASIIAGLKGLQDKFRAVGRLKSREYDAKVDSVRATKEEVEGQLSKLGKLNTSELLEVARAVNADATLTLKTPKSKIIKQITENIQAEWKTADRVHQ